ncbi:MAG: enoyl-ACP reductase [Proteobacteria bacterium]|nr:enoyl-ACP reductase [Pseudomonadota bacterium]MYJ94690.1 enoyl-ACP reductase [Pseudomonadota bacterium]
MGILDGKRAVVVGLASNRSIAWGIARALHSQGAELAFSYQTGKLRGRVEKMAGQLESDIVLPLDVSEDAQIESFFDALAVHWDGFDVLVHSVAYAPADQLAGRYLEAVSREGFRIAHDISSYSLAALAKAARPMMLGRQAALLTLSYLGAVRALPSYNVMGLAKASLEANVRFLAHDLGPDGIRVNAISAGPIRTLAASGIKGLRQMLAHVSEAAPLRRNVTIDDVGNAASFLVSDLAAGVTGEILYVDAGYNIVGMHMPPTP